VQGRKYFWENDYADGDVLDYIASRDIVLKPAEHVLEDVSFSAELLEPVLERIDDTMSQRGKFVVIGDYDMDGVSATAILVRTLRLIGADVSYYIPNRFTDGYGVNAEIITRLHADGVKCFITVDNGIVAYDAAERAQALGVPLIITDHHLRGEQLPNTPYILHPALDESLCDIDMCGASVAYLLARALIQQYECWVSVRGELLQLAALGTIADMMPLDVPWNRALSYYGFAAMKDKPLLLLLTFLRLQQQTELSSDDLSFGFIPAINAVGRLQDSNIVVAAFLSSEKQEVEQLMARFIACNTKRKAMTDELYDEILAQLTDEDKNGVGFLLIVGQAWHQGILGIVAQRVMQSVGRPVIVLTSNKEDVTSYTGSARAFGAYSVKDCLHALAALLRKGGGHAYAGGLSVDTQDIDKLRKRLGAYNTALIKTIEHVVDQMPIKVDTWLPLQAVNKQLLRLQDGFAPYGEHNKKFIIGIRQVQVIKIQALGAGQKHVKLHVVSDGKTYQIVAFHMYDLITEIANYAFVDLVIEVGRNTFNGHIHMQYLLVDIRAPRKQIFDLRQQNQTTVSVRTYEGSLVVHEVPLNKITFLRQLKSKKVEKIYLQKMPFENALLYTEAIDLSYFAFIYKYMRQKEQINLQRDDVYHELMARQVPKSIFLYILQVFFELNFVIIENNICSINLHAPKSDLSASSAYNEMTDWLRFRNTLLTGTIDTLYETLTMQ